MAIQQIQHGHGATIYPSDTESISDYLQVYGRSTCLYIGTGGNLRVLTVGGDDVTFRNVQSGQFLPVMVTKVFLTGTTASNITVVDMGPGRFRGLLFDYSKRVSFDGGVVEGGACVDAVSSLLQSASLLLIPSGYKANKLYSEIPTNGNGDLTWTRGSDAFRTNASGVIQRVPWNLLQRSEEFDNAVWSKVASSITSNSTTAPDGNTTADTITDNSTPSVHTADQNVSSAGTYTFSVYAKKGTLNFVGLYSTQSGQGAFFNINTGAFSSNIVNAPTSNSITNVGNGWYRCAITTTTTSSSQFRIMMSNDGTSFTYVGSGQSIFIWGAQLVEGTTAQTYLPTTDRLNFPRLSYMYGSCPSALLEPQRTNLALQSETFDNASWTKLNSSITANTTTSPDGSTNADSLIENSLLADHNIIQNITVANATAYTCSVYFKANTRTKAAIQLAGTAFASGGNGISIFDLSSGTVVSSINGATATIQSVGNGWYRCTSTKTTVSTTGIISYNLIDASNNLTYTGNGTSGVFLYGAQLEAGAYPTIYIPTTSATATRVADSFSRNNIYTNGLISASGGTWFVELRGNLSYVRDTGSLGIELRDALSNRIYINTYGSGQRCSINVNLGGTITELYRTLTDTVKMAIKWNGSTVDLFVNGTKVSSATSFTPTQLETLNGSSTDVPRFIQQMALFPTPLSDTDCQLLTAL